MKQLTIPEFHAALKGQGVSGREHVAFKCCICGTVQSMASLKRAGCPDDRVENQVGFSCEGRWSEAGPWPRDEKEREQRRSQSNKRGCNWTLGGLLRVHQLEIIDQEGKPHPMFEVASPDEAQALEAWLKTQAEATAS